MTSRLLFSNFCFDHVNNHNNIDVLREAERQQVDKIDRSGHTNTFAVINETFLRTLFQKKFKSTSLKWVMPIVSFVVISKFFLYNLFYCLSVLPLLKQAFLIFFTWRN